MKEYVLVLVILLFSDQSYEDIENDVGLDTIEDNLIQERTKELLEDDKFDLSLLPVHSRVTRNSSCPNVTEDVVQYRLDVPDKTDRLVPVLIYQTILNDHSYQTNKLHNPAKPWHVGSVYVRPYLNCLDQEDETLINIIKNDYLVGPDGAQYNFSKPLDQMEDTSLRGEVGQPVEVDELVYGGNLKNGFFLEAGAHDFETNSDSLYFELTHNWSGLLVEPHPLGFQAGLEKHRKATSIQTCLSTSNKSEIMNFDIVGSVRNDTTREAMAGLVLSPNSNTVTMQCLPLYSLLLAMGNPTVHYFSLDIEGAEFEVLKTIPWDKVDIRVLSVETHLVGRVFPGTRQDVVKFMASVGYQHVNWAHRGTNQARDTLGTRDDMFVKKGINIRRKEEL